MSLTVTLKVNSSPVEKIGKDISTGTDFTCRLKEECNILKPVIIVTSSSSLAGFNYMYIADFGRYYFIDNIKLLHNNLWEISGHVDVLETYKTAILANDAVIKRQQNMYNLYLDDPEFKTYNYERIQTLQFPGSAGMYKNLKYVLVVNGSYETQGGE